MEPVVLYKKIGETPLACMERYRLDSGIDGDVSMTYAGRLDPLAEGVLLVLVGDAVYKKEKYLSLDKEYVVDILLGVSTDTHDVLGLVTAISGAGSEASPALDPHTHISKIKSILSGLVGTRTQKYPRFSSRTIFGKPLFSWARQGKLRDEDIPSRKVTIYDINFVNITQISRDDLIRNVREKIDSVDGDFRQAQIISRWQEVFGDVKTEQSYSVLTIQVSCSSGTYMRTLAQEIGQLLSIPALAFNIKRLRVGSFTIDS